MSVPITLVTVYEVVGEDESGNRRPENLFYDSANEAFEKSKGRTWSNKGLPPKEHDAIKLPDGTIRLLGKVVITPYGTGADAEKAERDAARAKLTRREREILGVKE